MNSQIKDAALQYLNAANLLQRQPPFSGVLLPQIVNAAFSIELFLKAHNASDVYNEIPGEDGFIVTARSNLHGHSFINLFKGIPNDLQIEMISAYSSELGGSLKEVLNKYSEAFIKIRYMYEDGEAIGSINLPEFMNLANFIGAYA